MRNVAGLVLVLGGIAAGLYAGLWWAFIGGIVQVIEAIKSDPVSAIDIALGCARVLFAGFIGVMSAFFLVFPGVAIIKA